ncbi:glycosyltransferase family A protein [uncultured Desulfovibrio sp.]|uniref:glycosyltransferase family 2 protein n=1 Tax=uncultured Desulfovibrio sp. TaxID=167968 RepID=UPI0025E00BB5|nr:glycosyltransferase family A protein [uncultured Desulfovibrio sp.]
MKMKRPVSVIIPCRNGTNYLSEAVASVRGQGIETEIIVVDDGSTDATAELARSLGCRVFVQPASGPSRARNLGLQMSRGDFVMFLDHDDVLADGALATMLAAAESQIDIVASRLRDFVSPELSEAQAAMLQPREAAYGGLLTGAYLFRRGAFEELGSFNEELPSGECVDFLLRCRAVGTRLRQIEAITCHRRLHLDNTGRHRREAEHKGYAASLRARLLSRGHKR